MGLFNKRREDKSPADPKHRAGITDADIPRWEEIFRKYRDGKKSVENRVISAEQWWRKRSWEEVRPLDKDGIPHKGLEPESGWLVSACTAKIADLVENQPQALFRPQAADDVEEARRLTSIFPSVLRQAGFEKVYEKWARSKILYGTGIIKWVWDSTKDGGLGDITLANVSILNVYTQPGEPDVQKSRYVFEISAVENDLLLNEYPELKGKLGGAIDKASFYHDDAVDTTGFSLVKEVYYKKDGLLHYAKYTGNTLLYASENDSRYKKRGFYDHGLYPYTFDACFAVADSPFGTGYIDRGKSAQEYIDKADAAILKNLYVSASPRLMYRRDGGVNPEDFTDLTKDAIPVEGSLDEAHIRFVQNDPLNGNYITVVRDKINEMKETLGNRDVSNGGITGGATAASAIAAQQEAAGKESRLITKGTWTAFEEGCTIALELIRQFYDTERSFRITGENGEDEFYSYTNEAIKSEEVSFMGVEGGNKRVVFDIEVVAQKKSRYTQIAQNELMFQFYGKGFFRPELADQALAALQGMDFDGKEKVVDIVSQNKTLFDQVQMLQQQLMTLAQQYDAARGTNVAGGVSGELGMQMGAPPSGGKVDLGGESSVTANARERSSATIEPR